jgi:uncharacterized protein (TIGR03435 family)
MKRIFLFSALAALTTFHDHCQELNSSPAFEVVSITPCKPGTPPPPGEHAGMVQFIYPGGRFEAKATTLKFLIEWAYNILPAQHGPTPAWMEEERFDILAKAAGPASDEQMKKMAQRMLTDRFHLVAHQETREVPLLILQSGKTPPKITPAKADEKHGMKMTPVISDEKKVVSYHVELTRFSLAQLSDILSRQLDRVIVNQSGLDGEYDLAIDFTPDETRPNPLDPSLVISAMHDQLGFVLKTQKGPADFLVIDSAEKPAAN